ncbi:apolipoprotein N-acyltransferase [Leptospira stimsonii]|uniref:Apolipoprotein N-acyltransferase n=1 Tax=Leptospira stimsonii TaxID=2202203 RepID=A0ABY2N5K1_9LEPT|nr:nitrilase-related carbon-nitrogen hydrolase [Leptospira stimsonii]TGK26923.1 apolipoprotein N-acyltransferase [Leptospira stimsonii]TGM17286.1 apolipoprotein N-acyltransferase [Leptospira stimsonii]
MFYRFVPLDSFRYRLLLCFGVGFGVLFGLSPFSFLSAGIVASVSALSLFLSLNRGSLWKAFLWLLLLSQILNFTTFLWIPGSVSRISGTGPFVSFVFFLFYGLISHFKFVPFYIIFRFSNIQNTSKTWNLILFPAAGTFADLITFQIFPWYWGNLVSGSIVFEQFASLLGVYGLSFLLLFISSTLSFSIAHFRNRKSNEFKILLVSFIAIFIVYGYGLYKIGFVSDSLVPGETKVLSVVMIQPDTSPGTKDLQNDEIFLASTMSRILSLALQGSMSAEKPPSLIILPESAIPFHGTIPSKENQEEHIYSSTMEGVILYLSKHTGADVLFNELNLEDGKLRNQISLFKNLDGITERYNKRRLLAFGEYLPWESKFPFLRKTFQETSRYVSGDSPKLLTGTIEKNSRQVSPPDRHDLDQLKTPERMKVEFSSPELQTEKIKNLEYSYSILPLLCYEAMFTDLVLDYFDSKERPDLLINLTNDSWFDSELEANQHSGTVRLRAIETGIPMIRSTVSGITNVWDARGISLITPVGFHETAIRTFSIQLNPSAATFYTRIGNSFLWIVCSLIILLRLTITFRSGRKV